MDSPSDLTWMATFPLNQTLAQTAPPLSGSPAAGAAPTGGAATSGGAATGAAGAGAGPSAAQSPFPSILLFAVMGAFILFIFLGNRRETKRKQSLLESLKKNDRVQTVGGIIGAIVELKPDVVVLKVDENSNTRVTFARSSVVGVVKEAAPDASTPTATAQR